MGKKTLNKLIKMFSRQDCLNFLRNVIQNATLQAAQVSSPSDLSPAEKHIYDLNPSSVLVQDLNATIINRRDEDPQSGDYHTRAQADPFSFSKTITLYSGYFSASAKGQAQILVHEGTHLIYPFSDGQLAQAAGKPGATPEESSSNYQKELEKHCK